MAKMSNEQAITQLEFLARNYAEMNRYGSTFKGVAKLETACKMGVEALKEQRAKVHWKPYKIKGRDFFGNGFICECGRIVMRMENFCPECGAEMLIPKKEAKNG